MVDVQKLSLYFAATGDRHYHVYDFGGSRNSSPIHGDPKSFGGGGTYEIRVLDSYGGKRPTVYNYDLVAAGNADLGFRPTFILDSQLVSVLHEYRAARTRVNAERVQAVRSFISYVSSTGFDYNPAFYLAEALSKSDYAKYVQAAAPVATSLLYLQSMDTDHFASTGDLILTPDALAYYYDLYRSQTLEDCGKALVEQFAEERIVTESVDVARGTYACLLKMTLIHKGKPKASIESKVEEFEEFLTRDIGGSLARESQIAVYYFADWAGRADSMGRFLPVQPGMDFEKAKRVLWATAWDVFLLRLPERLLNSKQLPEVVLGYVCSADRALVELGALFQVFSMIVRSDNGQTIGPNLAIKIELLEKKLGEDVVRKLIAISAEQSRKRSAVKREGPIPRERIVQAVDRLEAELAKLCK